MGTESLVTKDLAHPDDFSIININEKCSRINYLRAAKSLYSTIRIGKLPEDESQVFDDEGERKFVKTRIQLAKQYCSLLELDYNILHNYYNALCVGGKHEYEIVAFKLADSLGVEKNLRNYNL